MIRRPARSVGKEAAILSLLGTLALASVECSSGNTGQAAIATAVTVAAVGVNRQATGDCWARCSKGYACDPESGTCVAGECAPECVPPSRCTLVGIEFACNPEPDVLVQPLPGGGIATGNTKDTADMGVTGNAANTARGQVKQDQQAVLGPTAYANQGPPGPGEPRAAAVKQGPACPRPGSDAWFEQGNTSSKQSGAPREPRPLSDLHRDFVGVWVAEPDAQSPSQALAVSSDTILMRDKTPYEVVAERDGKLIIGVSSPVMLMRILNVPITFYGTDRIEFDRYKLRRYDCRAPGPHDDMCCSLPRARWVRLGPNG